MCFLSSVSYSRVVAGSWWLVPRYKLPGTSYRKPCQAPLSRTRSRPRTLFPLRRCEVLGPDSKRCFPAKKLYKIKRGGASPPTETGEGSDVSLYLYYKRLPSVLQAKLINDFLSFTRGHINPSISGDTSIMKMTTEQLKGMKL